MKQKKIWGDLEEEIFMDCPKGLEEAKPTNALVLKKCIYGLVQAARQYHKKAVQILQKIGFEGGDVDPCLYVWKNNKGIVFIAIYVDDNLLVGNKEAIDKTIELLQKEGFNLKIEDNLEDYLSCNIHFSKSGNSAWLGQLHLIANLNRKFGKSVETLREYKTPGTPGYGVSRPTDEDQKISMTEQSLYQSGIGMLLYLVKHSRPDIANAVRKCTKVLDGASTYAYREMLQIIKYVLDTKDYGLRIDPIYKKNKPWDLVCYSDSDYAGDSDTRRSVSAFILYVCSVPISWRSKAQQSVTLSNSEAKWVALSELVKEVIFVSQLLTSMKIHVQHPIIVRVDNVGAIFMAQNVTTTSQTKHVDIRYKFVNEYVEDGIVKIIFVKSKENDADIFTKNLNGELHATHSSKFVKKK